MTNLNCLNDIITNDLAIDIDISNLKSWDLNNDHILNSLTKWFNAYSDNIELKDWGLTAFDVGRTNEMWGEINLTPNNIYFNLHKVGYNNINNPTNDETTGVTASTTFLPVTPITGSTYGNYFELTGGYLQGFFKLDGYTYELLPSRYNRGITIETLVYLNSDSKGIFYMMGTKSEDKYNPYFSGETKIVNDDAFGVFTSKDNHLDSIEEVESIKKAFREFENNKEITFKTPPQSGNTSSNIISFEITEDKKIGHKIIDNNNRIIYAESKKTISPTTGWTIITISYTPNFVIEDDDILSCYPVRTGDLTIYVNGRSFWTLKEYPEFFFKRIENDSEKQIGVPYTISWGGGSFGLKNSWHYDFQTYNLYKEGDQTFIDNNFDVESNPFPDKCDTISGGTTLSGLTLSADTTTFKKVDDCDPNIKTPVTVMRVEKISGFTANTYFIKFDNPITVISNRIYDISFDLFVNGFFRAYDTNNFINENKVSILVYGTEDVDIIEETEYKYPLTSNDLKNLPNVNRNPLFDDEFSYVKDGVSVYGETGLPVHDDPDYYLFYGVSPITGEEVSGSVVTGQNTWLPMRNKFKIKDNTGKQIVNIGILIETSDKFNVDQPLFIRNFTYRGADILVQDPNKDNLLIEQNFDSSFNGGIQKLRIYEKGLSSQEILHNALIEKKKNPNLNLNVNKGGRIINI